MNMLINKLACSFVRQKNKLFVPSSFRKEGTGVRIVNFISSSFPFLLLQPVMSVNLHIY